MQRQTVGQTRILYAGNSITHQSLLRGIALLFLAILWISIYRPYSFNAMKAASYFCVSVAITLTHGCTSTSNPGMSMQYCSKYPSVHGCRKTLIGGDPNLFIAAKRHTESKNFVNAWAVLTLTPQDSTVEAIHFLRQEPDVYHAGKRLFEVENLQKATVSAAAVYARLNEFTRFATEEDATWALRNVENVLGPLVEPPPQKPAASAEYGRIVDVQIVDASQANSGAGAQLGALAGQTMYIDSMSFQDYRATGQVAAGVIGAVLGSALDRPTQPSYEVNYWIKKEDGDTIPITRYMATAVHLPVGACVQVRVGAIALSNEANCDRIVPSRR